MKTGNTHMVKRADLWSYAFLTITNKVVMLPDACCKYAFFYCIEED